MEFFIRGKALKISDEYTEVLNLAKVLFDIFDSLYKPTKIVYDLKMYDNVSAYGMINFPKIPEMVKVREITSDTGISYSDLINDIQMCETDRRINCITGIYFENGKTKFILKHTDIFVDRYSKEYQLMYEDQIEDFVPEMDSDPLRIKLSQSISKGMGERVLSSDPVYYKTSF